MKYAYPLYGPVLIAGSPSAWLAVATKTDKWLTRTNIFPYKKKISPLDQPVGIKFAYKSDGNYYALFLIQQQIVGQSNSANLAGQDTSGSYNAEKDQWVITGVTSHRKTCQSTFN